MVNKEWELQSGLKFNMDVPSTVEEFDKLPGGRAGLALECAIDDVMYRGPFADVRDALADALEKTYTDMPRNRKPHSNPEKAKMGETVIDESPGKYISRLAAAKADGDASKFQSVLDSIMTANAALPADDKNKIKFTVEKVARTGGGNLVGKGDLEMAKQLMDQGAEKLQLSIDKLVAAMSTPEKAYVIKLADDQGQPLDAGTQQKNIALALKEYRAMIMKQQFAGIKA